MTIAKRLMGKAIATWLGPTGDAARRAVARVRGARTLVLYYDLADPWSYLAAQVAQRLLAAYPQLDFAFHAITPPASDVDAFPQLRAKHAVRDAQELAAFYDLEFPGKREAEAGASRDVGTVLVVDRPARDQLTAALELGTAMWSGDRAALAKLVGKWGGESHGAVAPILNANYAELRRAGHYTGGMLQYGGEWYGAVDRLRYLEAAIASAVGAGTRDLGAPAKQVVAERPLAARGALAIAEKQPAACEMWFSFRSPYSYLALEQIEAVLAPYRLPLKLRVVPPLVTRGAGLPTAQRLYAVRDAKREADRLGIPFGTLCDPLPGVDNCVALAMWADQRGRLLPLAKSLMRGIWNEARDVTEYVDLRFLVERAELPWAEARSALDDLAPARKWAQVAATELAVFSLWGVPSFKIGDVVTWGQDRLPLLADRLRRNALATDA